MPPGEHGFHADVMTTAMVTQLLNRSLVYSGVVDMRARGLTPMLAATLSQRMAAHNIRSLDISMNNIKIEGFVHVCRGLLLMKDLEVP